MTRWSDASDEEVLGTYVREDADERRREEAFAELVDRFEHRVFAVCYRYFGDRADAEDATQDAFVTLARKAHTFAGRSKLSTWLYRVAVNACNDLARREARRPRTPVADVGEVADLSVPDTAPEVAEGHESAAQVQAALLELDDTSRTLVILVAIEGRPYDEVAEAFDLPVGTVKSRVHRARAKLAERLRPVGEATEPGGPS